MKENAMNTRKLLLGALLLVLLTAACSPPPPLRDDTMLRDFSLTDNQPCSAPCWNNITPGETAWSAALTILEDDEALSDPSTRNPEDEIFPNAVVAEFSRSDGTTCCQIITLDGETVSTVFLRLAPGVTVGQVVSNFGEPEYLALSPYSETEALANLVYPARSTVIYAFVEGEATGALSAESEVIGGLYITPTDMEELLVSSPLHAWEGYESYKFYAEGELEVTPQPTATATPASE